MLATCISTVRGLRTSMRAISALVCPCATIWRISCWRRVRSPERTRGRALPEVLDDRLTKRLERLGDPVGQRACPELARCAVGVGEVGDGGIALVRSCIGHAGAHLGCLPDSTAG